MQVAAVFPQGIQVVHKVPQVPSPLLAIRRVVQKEAEVCHPLLPLGHHPHLVGKAGAGIKLLQQLLGGKDGGKVPQPVVVPPKALEAAGAALLALSQSAVKAFVFVPRLQPCQLLRGVAVKRGKEHLGQLQVQKGVLHHLQEGCHRGHLRGIQKAPLPLRPKANLPPLQRPAVPLRLVPGRAQQNADIPQPHGPPDPVLLHRGSSRQQGFNLAGDVLRLPRLPFLRRLVQQGQHHRPGAAVIVLCLGNEPVLFPVQHLPDGGTHGGGEEIVNEAGGLPPGAEVGAKGDFSREIFAVVGDKGGLLS